MNSIYKVEELVPIVGKLAEKYTAMESTSVTFEKAEQWMGAVRYCIQEFVRSGKNDGGNEADRCVKKVSITEPLATRGLSAWQAYEAGAMEVREKTHKALQIYNELLPEFNCYGSRCLYDTVALGLPEFFKWYDVTFDPQDTIVTLDYPVLKDCADLTGIDRIYQYILCIKMEQMFLNCFSKEYVSAILRRYHAEYEELPENICEIVLDSIIGHILAKKPFSELVFTQDDYRNIQTFCLRNDIMKLKEYLKQAAEHFLRQHLKDDDELLEYFQGALENFSVRLKNAAEQDSVCALFYESI